jgi:hypothetical protein
MTVTLFVSWEIRQLPTLVVDFGNDTLPVDSPAVALDAELYTAWRSAELAYKALGSRVHDALLMAEAKS